MGGAGTLALTLALQDLSKRMINGLAITSSDVFNVGDKIILGDGEQRVNLASYQFAGFVNIQMGLMYLAGTSGEVLNVGWLSTEIRGEQ